MQLDLLRLRLSDADLRGALPQLLPPDVPVKDLLVSFAPAGIVARGKYTGFPSVSFEALVKVIANGAVIGVQLADLNAAGPLGGMLRGFITGMIAEKLKGFAGVEQASSGVIINANKLLESLGFASRLREVKLVSTAGELTVEASGSIVVADLERARTLREAHRLK